MVEIGCEKKTVLALQNLGIGHLFFLPSFPKVKVWCPLSILSFSYWTFRLWKSAIFSSSCLRCSSTCFISSSFCCREDKWCSRRELYCSAKFPGLPSLSLN